jgi:Domain of Unknown Function (DUF1080)
MSAISWFRTVFTIVFTMALLNLPSAAICDELRWRSLTPDPSLKGWSLAGGRATFAVDGADIVGRSVLDSPNSFLITRESFADFILEYDARVDPRLNSGVMIRAEQRPDYRNGVVFGYQVEIDSSARAWSGGIYDEQRREWLNTLSRNVQARAAFKVGEWNHFRVEALGNRIRTFVNGVAAANLIDDMTSRGFIGLQVHSVHESSKLAGLEARFRNIRILTDAVAAAATPLDAAAEEHNYLSNQLTQVQIAQGWRLLWDGVSTSGWRGARLQGFPDRGWTLRDGVLSVNAAAGGESTNGGDIITREEFANFELELDFRISPGANSGIKYFVDPELGPTLGLAGSAIGLEFQILDDERHPDANMGVRGNRTMGSLYDLIPATNLDEWGRTAKRVLPPGEWNRARIVVQGRRVEHWLNGVKVVEYERGTQMFRALVNNSKYKDMPGFGERERGPILLQDHGDSVSFRSIKIRSL